MVKRAVLGMVLCCIGVGCSAEQRAEMEAEKLESFELTNEQRAIADALVAGYKAETGMAILRSRDYARAACYAKTVDMPSRYRRAHLLYLENYAEADADFYPFFQGHGIDDNTSYEMSERFNAAYDKCA